MVNLAFKIQNLCLVKNHKVLLDRLTCHIPTADISLILGPNGAGKTLLLRCIVGLQIIQQELRGAVDYTERILLMLSIPLERITDPNNIMGNFG